MLLSCSRELDELLDSRSCTIFGASLVSGFSIDVFKAALEVLPYAPFEFIPFANPDGRHQCRHPSAQQYNLE
ncbi:hypothetical protein Pyn_35685 [Prunus yedoensis var. nudiflora]|uniref:Uncharacterized protein n=1 Tax=Prunus yedoensis var. nudiflora TaxID=2094558 RepID=A0A314Z9Z3_PRUYE|nr:hypothetical protein Pyn_35685 [Prunus yedoensis var. nudiflora]